MSLPVLLAQTEPPETDNIEDVAGVVDVSAGTIWERIDTLVDGFLRLLPNIVIGILVFLLFLLVGKLVASSIRRSTRNSEKHHLGLVLGRISKWVILLSGILVAMAIIAPSVSPADLLATLGIGGIAIGFAFKDILQNFLAGILLLVRQPFKLGDQIEVSDYEGTVKEIDTRSTIIVTYDGKRVIIPNSEIFTNPVMVNTANASRRSEYLVGIGYADDLDETRRLILETLAGVEGVTEDPAPQVLVDDLAESSVNLKVRWWTKPQSSEVTRVRHRVILEIKKALDEAGVDMPYPTQVLLFHDQTEETDGDRTRQREGWPAGEAPPAPARLLRVGEAPVDGDRRERSSGTG